ncbi:UPF0016-domain-containing protein [Westerdykella ornata]|uniref:UPF0016-domain-containing protein n=1 Tax=Westerdykella ornata TaxID=318751 RepID=A0A6A6JDA7_WESOR|nr:UPF0016-domain-containing protein [Westerdykella ornata]KAF2274153.1 UPF0016-domain-containing protein [Westerdykella ornata]
MRLRPQRAPALLLLLPTLHVLALATTADSEDTNVARAALPAYGDVDTPPAPPSPPIKATKDAPVDGLDGKPHDGPWVDDHPVAPKDTLQPAVVEELRPGASKSSSTHELTKQEWAALGADGDGVMDDPNRQAPKGNTGTEGGVSAKDQERKEQEGKTGAKLGQVPQQPKEAPPHPHTGQEPLEEEDDHHAKKRPGAQGLAKPTDLPDTPHDIPHPVPPSLPKDDPLGTSPPSTPPKHNDVSDDDDEHDGVIQPFHSFILSLTMIIFSEIGDKTFLVAALMAMRHPRVVVFTAAFSALIAMTVLSAVLGHAVPTLIPERFTHFAAAVLFAVFGVKLLREGLAMSPEEGVGEEMREVEQELEEKEHLAARRGGRRKSSISPYVLESGRARRSRSNSRLPAPARSPSSSPARSPSPNGSSLSGMIAGLNNLFSLLLSPAWVQTFVMTFLGEWGDRSQIATIAMAAGSDYWWVTSGAVVGHGCCTAVAVLGGRAIAGKVSMRVVTLGGAIAFLIFAIIYFLECLYHA